MSTSNWWSAAGRVAGGLIGGAMAALAILWVGLGTLDFVLTGGGGEGWWALGALGLSPIAAAIGAAVGGSLAVCRSPRDGKR